MATIKYTTTILKFDSKGEKTGWTYIEIPAELAEKLNPGVKKSYRVKGKLDGFAIKQTALLPMGEGAFIMPLNAIMRKGIGKRKGAELTVYLQLDEAPLVMDAEFLECLEDEPKAREFYNTLKPSEQKYYSQWISSAKTASTKAKRITQAINGFIKKQGFSAMLRTLRAEKQNLL